MIKNHIKKLLSCMVVLAMVLSTLMYSNVDAVDEGKQLMIQVLNNVATESSEKVISVGIYQNETDEDSILTQKLSDNDIATFDLDASITGEVFIKLLSDGSTNSTIDEFKYSITDDSNKQYCVYNLTDKSFTTDKKLTPSMLFEKDSLTVQYGDDVTNDLTTNVTVSYESNNDDVATVDENTGKVTTVKPGEAKITAKVNDEDFENIEASYSLTVTKRDAGMQFADSMGIANGEKTIERIKGTLKNEVVFNKELEKAPKVTYESSAPAVAKIDASTGDVELLKNGKTTITATLVGDDYYNTDSKSYILNVVKKDDESHFANVKVDGVDQTLSENNDPIELVKITNAATVSNLNIEYSIDGGQTWDSQVPTENKMGKYDVTVRLSDDDYVCVKPPVTSILREQQKIVLKHDKNISLNEDGTFDAEYDKTSSKVFGDIAYKSNKENVASVDENGKVSFVSFGDATITLSVDKVTDDTNKLYYDSAEETYNVTCLELKDEDVQNAFTIYSNYQEGQENQEAYLKNNTFYGKDSITIVCNDGYSITDASTLGFRKWTNSITYTVDKSDVQLRVKNKNGVTSRIKNISHYLKMDGDIKFDVDSTAPYIDGKSINIVKKDENKILRFFTFGLFGNGSLTIKVPAVDEESGYAKAVLYENKDGKYNQLKECNVDEESGLATFELNPNVKYPALYLKLIDHVGNESKEILINHENTKLANWNGVFNLETNKPELENIQLSKEDYQDSNSKKWYNNQNKDGLPTVAFDAKDVDSGLYAVKVTVNGTVLKGNVNHDTSIDVNGNTKVEDDSDDYLFDFRDVEQPDVKNFKVNLNDYQNMISYSKEDGKIYVDSAKGEYNVSITVYDKAGNVETKDVTFYEDITSPEITSMKFTNKAGSSKEDATNVVALMQDNKVYGYFFNEDTTVTITANDFSDEKSSSGLNKIYYKLVKKGEKFDETDLTKYDSKVVSNGQIQFTVSKGFKGQLYAYVDDHVGLQSKVNHPDGSAIENGKDKDSQHKNHAEAKIEYITNKVNSDVKGQPLFNGDVTLKLTMTDTFSGLHSVAYTVNGVRHEEVINIDNPAMTEWKVESTDSNLVTKISKEITLSSREYNMNDISVELNGYDNAGNGISAQKEVFSIDVTRPVIDVTYDNNDDDPDFENFFKADRTATITVTERNFDPNGFVAERTVDGKKETLSLNWTTANVVNNVYTDEVTHTATVTYNADADYEFSIVKCEDLAKNNALPFATQTFTIDKTKPTVQVSYNNNTYKNENYYNAGRVATITINEHNFETSRINVIGTATDNGATISFPATSVWSTNGDVHTATINYGYDGDFTFDIEYTDKAGNKMDDYQQEQFVVDMTAPTLDITGVADHSANAGDVQPVVTYSDTNFDSNGVSISYVGSNKGVLQSDGQKASQANGEVFTFKNPEKKKENDDIYTIHASVVDKAGNETTKEITYSVNRFGSTYELVNDIKANNGKYTNKEYNVVVNEINPDTLQKMSVKVSKNNTTEEITPSEYSVNKVNVNGSWNQYQYVINKDLFEKDGKYSVHLYSEDSAGNVNENIDEVKKANINFGIDKTKPQVVSINLENGTTYAENGMNGQVSINDNLVLDKVEIQLNGKSVKYTNKDDLYNFVISEKNSAQNAVIIAKDAAGNTTKLNIEDFFVTTNLFVRWYNNKPLFIGSIAVVVVLVGGAWYFLVGKKKVPETSQNEAN
ncbi:MAG: Ig-like domain-containing protein [Bacillota bacterium]|nr:Ig-like domain-containing protein [Bacillota bacterium]